MDKITKTFISKIKSIDDEKKIVEAVVSDETMDRYQEVIKIDAWKKGLAEYKKHGVLLSSHVYHGLMNQIGKCEKIYVEDGQLIAKFKYFIDKGNAEADWGYFLAQQGIAAFSVGFKPKPNGYETADWDDEDIKSGKKPVRTYTDVELLEISQVTVPANPAARLKSFGNEIENDLVMKEYLERVDKFIEENDVEIKDIEDEVVTKPDTENYVHIGVPGEEGKHSGHKIRTMTISAKEGIKSYYCVNDKKITGYLFDKSKGWTHEKAKKWVDDHSKNYEEEIELAESLRLEIEEDGKMTIVEEVSKVIEELKTVIVEKFSVVEEKFNIIETKLAEWETAEGEFERQLGEEELELKRLADETLEKEKEENDRKEVEELEKKQKNEEEENYIKTLLESQNEIATKYISVQS